MAIILPAGNSQQLIEKMMLTWGRGPSFPFQELNGGQVPTGSIWLAAFGPIIRWPAIARALMDRQETLERENDYYPDAIINEKEKNERPAIAVIFDESFIVSFLLIIDVVRKVVLFLGLFYKKRSSFPVFPLAFLFLLCASGQEMNASLRSPRDSFPKRKWWRLLLFVLFFLLFIKRKRKEQRKRSLWPSSFSLFG